MSASSTGAVSVCRDDADDDCKRRCRERERERERTVVSRNKKNAKRNTDVSVSGNERNGKRDTDVSVRRQRIVASRGWRDKCNNIWK